MLGLKTWLQKAATYWLHDVDEADVPRQDYEYPDFPLTRRHFKSETQPDTNIQPSGQFNIVADPAELQRRGLVPPNGDISAPAFAWVTPNGNPPASFRWMWNPETGQVLLHWGTSSAGAMQHALMLRNHEKSKGKISFDKWLRGYYIPGKQLVLMRPYGDESLWDDPEMPEVNAKVQQAAEAHFQRLMGSYAPNLSIMNNISNREAVEIGMGK